MSEPKTTNFSVKKEISYQEERKDELTSVNEMSQKILKKVKVREVVSIKKKPQTR